MRRGQAGWCTTLAIDESGYLNVETAMMAVSVLPGNADAEAGGWLTTVLRPAGKLDRAARRRLGQALDHLAASSDMVVIDLTATRIAAPRALARNLRAPALEFQRAGRCLLVVGAPPDLMAELDRAAVPVATIAADSVPLPPAA